MKETHERYINEEFKRQLSRKVSNIVWHEVIDKKTDLIQSIENDNPERMKKVLIGMKRNINKVLKEI